MKFTVSAPDDLVHRAEQRTGLTRSELVQRALECLLAGEEAEGRLVFTRQRPAIAAAEFAAARDRLAQEARARYEDGYQAGLAVAKVLHWRHLDRLAGFAYDLEQWIDHELAEAEEDARRHGTQQDGLFTVLDIYEGDAEEIEELLPAFKREAGYRQGVIDALRDVRNAVAHGRPWPGSEAITPPA